MGVQDTALSRLGQVNKAGQDDALFLKQFGGEILTEFEMACVFKSRHYVRTITNGKSAQFPMIGTVAAPSIHVPGAWIDGGQVGHAEQVLTVDGLLVAPVFVADIDELENHYDVRGPYSSEMGRSLAYQYDKNCGQMHLLAARASSPLTGRPGGSNVINATMNSNSDNLIAAMYTATQTLEEKNVPGGDRWVYIRPAQFYLLVQNTKVLYKDYGGSADISKGTIDTTAGLQIVKTNNLSSTDLSADVNTLTKYRGNYSTTIGVVANRWAVGTVQLADISLQSDYEPRRQGTFLLARLAVGHGVLRPDCAVELKTA